MTNEVRIMLNEAQFRTLVGGGTVEVPARTSIEAPSITVKIALSDIGFERMAWAIDRAEAKQLLKATRKII